MRESWHGSAASRFGQSGSNTKKETEEDPPTDYYYQQCSMMFQLLGTEGSSTFLVLETASPSFVMMMAPSQLLVSLCEPCQRANDQGVKKLHLLVNERHEAKPASIAARYRDGPSTIRRVLARLQTGSIVVTFFDLWQNLPYTLVRNITPR